MKKLEELKKLPQWEDFKKTLSKTKFESADATEKTYKLDEVLLKIENELPDATK